MSILILLIYAAILIIEFYFLAKKKYWREVIVFSIFALIACELSILYVSGVNIPSPAKLMQYVVEDLLHLKYPE